MKILVIEDDARTASFILKGLRQAGFVVEHARDGRDAMHDVLTSSYDAAIIDIMLPSLDGLALIRELRSKKVTMPVLILSAKASLDDRVKGLQQGGDDYLAKPFAFVELLARLQALLRRNAVLSEPVHLVFDDLSLDLLSRKVSRGGRVIELKPGEFSLLEYLMRNAGRVVSKTMIMEQVWNYNFDPETNVVEARICRLREKIDRGAERKLIHTIRGIGYVLREDNG
ncbi:MAG: response regulator transcription factor [Nitrospirota bacterium]|nr:response regulator transcription factor [Nitrospirota bacterium]